MAAERRWSGHSPDLLHESTNGAADASLTCWRRLKSVTSQQESWNLPDTSFSIQMPNQHRALGAGSCIIACAPSASVICFAICFCSEIHAPSTPLRKPFLHMRLLPCHFLVLSHSFTFMPSCEFHTSLILATLPSWHLPPTQASPTRFDNNLPSFLLSLFCRFWFA